jgi:tagatose 1,6-diphosphate aldolase
MYHSSLSLFGYEEGADEKGTRVCKEETANRDGSMREFSKERYGVDVLKVEVPVNMKFVEGAQCYAGQKAYSKQDAMKLFRDAASVAKKPFIYLSGWCEQRRVYRGSGTGGGVRCEVQWRAMRTRYLEGRAFRFMPKQGAEAFRKWLQTEGVKNINNVNDRLKAATSWHEIYGMEPATVGA